VDHAQERDRPPVQGQDRRAGRVELDLGLGRNPAELFGRERVERRTLREEARDLAQSGVQLELLVPDI
jgi:hypothetical protein